MLTYRALLRHVPALRLWRNWRIIHAFVALCRRQAERQNDEATHATLHDALGRFGASGEWDSASASLESSASLDSGDCEAQPAWTQSYMDRCLLRKTL